MISPPWRRPDAGETQTSSESLAPITHLPRPAVVRDEAIPRQTALEHQLHRMKGTVEHLEEEMHSLHQRRSIEQSIGKFSLSYVKASHQLQLLFWANMLVLAWIANNGAGFLSGSPGNYFLDLARSCGLVSTYLLIVQLILVARVPLLDRVYGVERLTRWHRINGHISFDLAILHAYGALMGRSLNNNAAISATWADVITYAWMPHAVLGTAIILLAIVVSVLTAKKKTDHKSWRLVHLWTYFGVALSFGHQIYGPDFLNRPFAQAYLWLLYGAGFACLTLFRVILPYRSFQRHQLRVGKVVIEGPGVTSLYLVGERLDEIGVRPGQFFWFRFLMKREWKESYPFSLSTAPRSDYLRITVKSLGDFSSRVHKIPIGTKVSFEGPFGAFSPDVRKHYKAVLIAGGIGITPIRSLLEGMESAPGDITVIYRADKVEDVVLMREMQALARRRQAVFHLVLGPRSSYPRNHQPLAREHLKRLVPDIAAADVYICASPGLTSALRETLHELGLSDEQVHHETF